MNKPYNVFFTKQAIKDLDKLQSYKRKALQFILTISENPLKGHLLKGSLKGVRSLEFSLPGGAYRAAYNIDNEMKECIVFMIGPHENFYEEAERRAKSINK